MKIGIFNTQGINKTEHFIPEEIKELRKRGYDVELYWVKGKHPTIEEINGMSFAVFHFVPTAYYFCNIGVPFCILPTAHDIFLDNGRMLSAIEKHPLCKFIGYQSFYHKKKYEEWGITKPIVHITHCVRTEIFKRQTQYNSNGGIIAGGRLIPKKGLDRLVGAGKITIFGDGSLRKSLEERLKLATFTGYLDGNQLKKLFEESSIYLFPAIVTPEGDSEGISNSVKEAMLMELQCIITPIAGNSEFENVAFLSDWSEEGIENAISCLPKEANIKGRKEILKNFSPEVCCNKLIDAINKYGLY
jgi:glycosyltransferase involved in cell wall biosynthesis